MVAFLAGAGAAAYRGSSAIGGLLGRKGSEEERKGKMTDMRAADRRGQRCSGEKGSVCGCALTSGTRGAVREKG